MTRTLIFDLESDGLLDELTTIHSLVVKDPDTGEVWSCHDHYPDEIWTYGTQMMAPTGPCISDAVIMLQEADLIVGHNIIKFDIPAIQKLYPWFSPGRDKVVDTLVLSRLLWPNIEETDWTKIRSGKMSMPAKLAGNHGLEPWGYRLGLNKGDYAKQRAAAYLEENPEATPEEIHWYVWGSWNQEMQDYCALDVEVTHKLYDLIRSKSVPERASKLEHGVAWVISRQERNGFGFDEGLAWELHRDLTKERVDLEEELRGLFDPWWVPDGPTKRWARDMRMKTGEVRIKGAERQPIKLQVFNPGSRDHIADRLMRVRGWKPTEFTPSGKPQVDENILSGLPYPEAKHLAKYFQVKKVLGQLADGDKGWLKFVRKGRIHGSVNTNGAVTGRATHSYPNLAQVPSPRAYRGAECRRLFGPLFPDHVQLGCDVSGLELRMLGHFMARHDDGLYAREVVEGDAHWANVVALELVEDGTPRLTDEALDRVVYVRHKVYRDGTKTFIYAFLYGAGGEKIGTIIFEMALAEEAKGIDPLIRKRFFKGKRKPTPQELKRVGNRLKKRFLERTPALKALIEGVTETAEKRGWLVGLDGRKLHIRSPHAALNTLLQSAGALVCKQWLVEFHELLAQHDLDDVVYQMSWVHDEVQLSIPKTLVRDDGTSIVGDLCVQAIEQAGQYFNLKVPLTGEYIIGANWAECH